MFEAKDLVSAGLYSREEDVLRDALRSLLWIHPEYRLELAVHAYQHSGISLSKAAHLAGLCFEEMKDLLLKRSIKIDLGPDSKEEIESEVEILGRKLDELHSK
jgi:predicted HTH domain antitoxin